MDVITRFSEAIGNEVGVGDWFEITQDRVDAFADVTNDHQWIHQSGPQATAGPFGGPIAHGLLTLSLLTALTRPVMTRLSEGTRMAVNYGYDRVRFITPVRVGSRLRGRVRLVEAEGIDGGIQVKAEVTVEIEGGQRPALVAENLVRFYL
ncbi:MAG TPA: MaoC family dehydratase [Acidimicrobiia bacterium]|jgi:acyl dehydratase